MLEQPVSNKGSLSIQFLLRGFYQDYKKALLSFLGLENFKKLYWPLERALSFKIFEKMQAILLYWFAAQQQTSTLRRQKIGFFYMKFSAAFNRLSLFF